MLVVVENLCRVKINRKLKTEETNWNLLCEPSVFSFYSFETRSKGQEVPMVKRSNVKRFIGQKVKKVKRSKGVKRLKGPKSQKVNQKKKMTSKQVKQINNQTSKFTLTLLELLVAAKNGQNLGTEGIQTKLSSICSLQL